MQPAAVLAVAVGQVPSNTAWLVQLRSPQSIVGLLPGKGRLVEWQSPDGPLRYASGLATA